MTPERFGQVGKLFDEVVELEPADRSAFLDRACAGDAGLRAEIESMLNTAGQLGSFLDKPVVDPHVSESRAAGDENAVIGTQIGQYKVLKELDRGGMGIVYQAHDSRLNRFVALKMLPGDMTADPERKRRLFQEARAASALNHPNIVTIYEIDERDGALMIVMEYVEGQTLAELIRDKGLDVNVALTYAIAIADALAKAHSAGIIHRDLKPTNIMVNAEGRVKILDFGLAKLLKPLEGAKPRDWETIGVAKPDTLVGVLAGTPAYMSPEQAEFREVDARSDIFAFGSVLYTMITGTQPFHGASTISILAAVLHAEPEPIASLAPSAPAELARIVDRAMRKDPDQRWQSMAEAKVALMELQSSPGILPPIWSKVLRSLVYFLLLIVILLVTRYAYTSIQTRWGTTQPSPAAVATHSVAVLSFKNDSGQNSEDWLSDELASTLADNLLIGNQLRVLPAREVAQASRELGIENLDTPNAESLLRLLGRLNADYVVSGSYQTLGKQAGGQVHVKVRLLDTATGKTLAVIDHTGAQDNVLSVIGPPSERLRNALGVPSSDLSGAIPSLPSDPAAARPYLEGLKKLDSFDSLGAIPLFQEAIAAAPKYALIHADLADAWSQLGYDSKARDAARKAYDLSKNLSPQQRLLVEGRYREINGEWDKALDIYRLFAQSAQRGLIGLLVSRGLQRHFFYREASFQLKA